MVKSKLPPETTCCILVEKHLKGTENQCIALANALNVEFAIKHPDMNGLWRLVSPPLLAGGKYAYKNADTLFSPPFPDIIIASGRKSILAGMEMKKRSDKKSFLIQVLDPRISSRHFDLVIAPEHDPIAGPNVIKITGALHSVSPAFLRKHAGHYVDTLDKLPAPRTAVLIGGSTRHAPFTKTAAERLGQTLRQYARNTGGSLMVTISRRTPPAQARIIADAIDKVPHHFWDGHGDNPYFDYLYMADSIIVTNDSVSMATEALGTGLPVYIAHIAKQGRRVEKFHQNLIDKKYTKPFTENVENYLPRAWDDMSHVVKSIQAHYTNHLNSKRG